MIRLSVITVLLSSIAFASSALACSCELPDGAKAQEYLTRSKAVFVGKVTKINVLKTRKSATGDEASDRDTVFRVEKVWKGVATPEAIIRGEDSGETSCRGFYFKEGESYLVFTDENSMSVNSPCSPTISLNTLPVSPHKELSPPPPPALPGTENSLNLKKFMDALGKAEITFEHKD